MCSHSWQQVMVQQQVTKIPALQLQITLCNLCAWQFVIPLLLFDLDLRGSNSTAKLTSSLPWYMCSPRRITVAARLQ